MPLRRFYESAAMSSLIRISTGSPLIFYRPLNEIASSFSPASPSLATAHC
jgi:hypothetical protein